MASKLRNTNATVSFFAFQDMITTVTGVLLLVTLMLTLYLNQPTTSSREAARIPSRDQVEEARRQLASNAEALRQRQKELASLTNRVFVIPEPDRSGRQPVLVVLSATNGCCTWLGQTNVIEFSGNARSSDFEKLVEQWDARQVRLVFYVRPSGVAHFDTCRSLARKHAFSIGYDAAEEDRNYILLGP